MLSLSLRRTAPVATRPLAAFLSSRRAPPPTASYRDPDALSPDSTYSPSVGWVDYDDRLCYVCGGKGHIARDCPAGQGGKGVKGGKGGKGGKGDKGGKGGKGGTGGKGGKGGKGDWRRDRDRDEWGDAGGKGGRGGKGSKGGRVSVRNPEGNYWGDRGGRGGANPRAWRGDYPEDHRGGHYDDAHTTRQPRRGSRQPRKVARDTSHLVWNENNNVEVTSCWDSADVEWELSRLGALATIEEREERERGYSRSSSAASSSASSPASSSASSPAASSAASSRRPPLPHICVAGESNSGKSSLLNHLLRKNNIARASSVAGKTRSVDLMTVNDGVVLADLPGLPSRDHQVERIWAKVIKRLRAFHMPHATCHIPHSTCHVSRVPHATFHMPRFTCSTCHVPHATRSGSRCTRLVLLI